VSGLTERQLQLVLIALGGITAIRGRRDLDDALLLEAVVALRKTIDTRTSGILYEHPAGDARAQDLVRELGAIFEAHDAQGTVRRPRDTDLSAALRALEQAVGATLQEDEGSHAFLDTAARLAGRLGLRRAAEAEPGAPSRPLIIEP